MLSMSPDELTKIGQRLYGRRHWNRRLADELGVDFSTAWRWASGKVPVPPATAVAVRLLLDKHKLRKLAA